MQWYRVEYTCNGLINHCSMNDDGIIDFANINCLETIYWLNDPLSSAHIVWSVISEKDLLLLMKTQKNTYVTY